MSLSVLNVAYPFAPVRNDSAGGAEQVLFSIDSGLMGLGHKAAVAACRGSLISGSLFETALHTGEITDELTGKMHLLHHKTICRAIESSEADIIHYHGLDFYHYMPQTQRPALVTLHLPVSWYSQQALLNQGQNVYFNCVSKSQQNTAPRIPRLLGYVNNGTRLVISRQRAELRSFLF